MAWAAKGLNAAVGSPQLPMQISQSASTESSRVSERVCLND